MPWYDSLDKSQRTLVATGVTAETEPENSLLTAWDLSSLDYNAAGVDGWVNRLIGSTGFANPLAVIQTMQGVAEDGGSYGDFIGEMFEGVFAGAESLNRIATSATLSIGAVNQAGQKLIAGDPTAIEDLGEDIGQSWDLAESGEIGFGDAMVYTQAQNQALINTTLYGLSNGLNPDKVRSAQQQGILSSSLSELGDMDVDIFNNEQLQAIKDQGGWVNYLVTNPLNFAGELVFDFTNLVPFGILGKAGKASRALTGTKGVENTIAMGNELKAISQGADTTSNTYKTLRAWDDQKFTASQLMEHDMFKGISSSSDRSLLAELVSKANGTEEKALVLRAVGFKDNDAMVSIANAWAKNPEGKLMLDATNQGGFVARVRNNPALANKAVDGVIDDEAYLGTVEAFLNENFDNKLIRGLFSTVDTTGDVAQAGLKDIRLGYSSGGAFSRATENASAKWLNSIKNNADQVFTKGKNGLPNIVTLLGSKTNGLLKPVSMLSVRSGINLEDSANSYDLVVAKLNNWNDAAQGSLKAEGLYDDALEEYRLATNAEERLQVLTRMEKITFSKIAKEFDISSSAMEAIAGLSRNSWNKYTNAMTTRSFAVLPGNVVINDPMHVAQTDNMFMGYDMKAVREFVRVQDKAGLKNFEVGDKYISGRTIPSTAYDAIHSIDAAVDFANRLWSWFILTRAARVPREYIQNVSSVALSGHANDWVNGWKSIKGENRFVLAKAVNEARYGKKLDKLRISGSLIEENIQQVDNSIKELTDMLSSIPPSMYTNDQLALRNSIELENSAETLYLVDNVKGKFAPTNSFRTASSKEEAYRSSVNPEVTPIQNTILDRKDVNLLRKNDLLISSLDNERNVLKEYQTNYYNLKKELGRKPVMPKPVQPKVVEPVGPEMSIEFNPRMIKLREAFTKVKEERDIFRSANGIQSQLEAFNSFYGKNLTREQFSRWRLSEQGKELVGNIEKNYRKLLAKEKEIKKTEKAFPDPNYVEPEVVVTPEPVVSPEELEKYNTALAEYTAKVGEAEEANRLFIKQKEKVSKINSLIKENKSSITSSGKTLLQVKADFENLSRRLRNGIEAGYEYQVKSKKATDVPSAWKSLTVDEIEAKGMNIINYDIRKVNQAAVESKRAVTVYGKTLDLTKYSNLPEDFKTAYGIKNAKDFKIISDSLNGDATFNSWAEGVGYGKIIFKDSSVPGGKIIYANPAFTATKNYDPVSVISKKQAEKNAEAIVNSIRQDYFSGKVLTDDEISQDILLKNIFNIETPDPETVTDYIKQLFALKSKLNVSRAKVSDEMISVQSKQAGKQLASNSQTYRGVTYGEAFEDTAVGNIFKEASDADTAQAMLSGVDPMRGAGVLTAKELQPNDKDYFLGWSTWLNRIANNDPITSKYLRENLSRDELVKWMSSSYEGKQLSKRLGLGKNFLTAKQIRTLQEADALRTVQGETIENYVDFIIYQTERHLPNESIKNAYREGLTFNEGMLRKLVQGAEDTLEPLDGMVLMPETRAMKAGLMSKMIGTTSSFLAGKPQTQWFNHPTFIGTYNRKMRENLDVHFSLTDEQPTVAQLNNMTLKARQDSLSDIKQALYNVDTKLQWEEAVGKLMPFFTAYTFTIKLIGRAVRENPAMLLWAGSMANKTVGQWNWVDQNGEPTSFFNATSLMIPLSDEVGQAVSNITGGGIQWDNSEQSIRLSKASMDMWFGGQGLPAFGPLVQIPVGELVKNDVVGAYYIDQATKIFPGGEGLVGYILPYGVSDTDLLSPQGLADRLAPGWARNLGNTINQSPAYKKTVAEIASIEDAKYRYGLRDTAPTEEEIRSKATDMYEFKAAVAFFSPVSFTPSNEYDQARNLFYQYKETYGDDEGTYRFLVDHPELDFAIATATSNNYGVPKTIGAVQKIQDNPETMSLFAGTTDKGRGLTDWALGITDQDWDQEYYDRNAAQWLENTSVEVGGESFIEQLSPSELKNKITVNRGWTIFNKGMQVLRSEAAMNGIDVADSKILTEQKRKLVQGIKGTNPEWYAAYTTVDATADQTKIDLIYQLFETEEWVKKNQNRPEIPYVINFLQLQEETSSILAQRKAAGGSGTLSSDENADLYKVYYTQLNGMLDESITFSDFYEGNFSNFEPKG